MAFICKQWATNLLSGNLRFKEPPVEWLLSVSRTGTSVYAVVGGLNFFLKAFPALHLEYYFSSLGMLILSCCHFLVYQILNGCIFGGSARMQHYATTGVFLVSASMGVWCCVFSPSPVYRHRSMGMIVIVWRLLVPIFGLRMFQCMLLVVIITVSEIVATIESAKYFDEIDGLERVVLNLVVSSVLTFGWCIIWISWRYEVFSNIKRVEFEKDACQSILSMVCDATFWAGDDGETVLSSDHRLQALLGKELQGKRFSHFMPESERERFQKLVTQTHCSPTRQIPITLICPNATSVSLNVDLLIFDRRDILEEHTRTKIYEVDFSSADLQHQPCFLIGIRVCSEIEQFASEAFAGVAAEKAVAKADQLAFLKPGSTYAPQEGLTMQSMNAFVTEDHQQGWTKPEPVPSEFDLKTVSSLKSSRYELMLDATRSKDRLPGKNLVRVSDFLIRGSSYREKNTFICFEDDESDTDERSVMSAPATLFTGEHNISSGSLMEQPTISEAITLSSSSSSSAQSSVNIKIGNAFLQEGSSIAGFRLSTLLSLKSASLANIGTAHAPGDCIPCQFFHHSRKSCRGSVLCEYCHDKEHFKDLPKRLRKVRPCDRPKNLSK